MEDKQYVGPTYQYKEEKPSDDFKLKLGFGIIGAMCLAAGILGFGVGHFGSSFKSRRAYRAGYKDGLMSR